MCGVAGFIDFNQKSTRKDLSEMIKTLTHRGPDDSSCEIFNKENVIVGMAHSRLAVIDLSDSACQPMHYKNYSIVFNGEIYNFQEIKNELELLGHIFLSNSDTEVILHAYEEWHQFAIDRFIGMFVIVIFDKNKNEIIFIRDRAGVKPLYYYWNKQLFLFASELKAFHKHPLFEKDIDKDSLNLYFNFGYIPSPYSIFNNTFKLDAGKYLIFDLSNGSIEINSYWDVTEFYKLPKKDISYDEAKTEVRNLLKSSFEYRMLADVPVGVFLSGGYDSTAVASILQRNRTSIKTFTIGFEEGQNEAPYAKEISDYLGTDHTELICNAKMAQEIIPQLPYIYDEPFADSSAIPTVLVSKLAKRSVTVALSADGGDELFAGYEVYTSLIQKLNTINRIPNNLKPVAKLLLSIGLPFTPLSATSLRHKLTGLEKSLNKNSKHQIVDLFRHMHLLPKTYQDKLLLEKTSSYDHHYYFDNNKIVHEFESVMAIDFKMYLQNDILTKVDRATMSVSLEGREPFLDHRLVEYVAQLPFNYKYTTEITKYILKDIVHDYVPKDLMDRPKAGFSLPIYSWLQKDLNYLIEHYLNPEKLNKTKLFNVPFIMSQVRLFQSGKLHYKSIIWKMLMFQMWYEEWMD